MSAGQYPVASNPSKITGFIRPKTLTDEMKNFLLRAKSLSHYTKNMPLLKLGISNSSIVTSLLSMYIYDKTNRYRPTLIYFASENVGSIKQYLNGMASATGNFTENETKILEIFSNGSIPTGVSNIEVVSALAKVGIDGSTRHIVNGKNRKVVSQMCFGLDDYIKNNLKTSVSHLEKARPADFQKNSFGISAVHLLVNAGFVQNSGSNFPLKDTDVEIYLNNYDEPQKEFRSTYRRTKVIIMDTYNPYNKMKNALDELKNDSVNYTLSNDMNSLFGPNMKTLIGLEEELQFLKIAGMEMMFNFANEIRRLGWIKTSSLEYNEPELEYNGPEL